MGPAPPGLSLQVLQKHLHRSTGQTERWHSRTHGFRTIWKPVVDGPQASVMALPQCESGTLHAVDDERSLEHAARWLNANAPDARDFGPLPVRSVAQTPQGIVVGHLSFVVGLHFEARRNASFMSSA